MTMDIQRGGIDLGTTNSVVYAVVGGDLVAARDAYGRALFPSMVWRHEGRTAYGREVWAATARARDEVSRKGEDPGRVPLPVTEIKRLMGTDQAADLGGEPHSPARVSALILAHLRAFAEEALRRDHPDAVVDLRDVVITVPARFQVAAKRATLEAARDPATGFARVQLLDEPVAAALALANRGDAVVADAERILVYDLGGGTFDIAVLERHAGGMYEVVDSGGHENLGGSDFDWRLARHIQQELVKRGYDLDGFPDEPSARSAFEALWLWTLKSEAERVKIALSAPGGEVIEYPFLSPIPDRRGARIQESLTLARSAFELLTADLIDETIDRTHVLLARQPFATGKRLSPEEVAGMSKEEVVARSRENAPHVVVVLVGGACRMPIVKVRLEAELGQAPRDGGGAQLDLAVAEGAAVRARSEWTGHAPESTPGGELTVELEYPESTIRTKNVPIAGHVSGPADGLLAVLVDLDTAQEQPTRIEANGRFRFLCNLREATANEFALSLFREGVADPVYERRIAITHRRDGIESIGSKALPSTVSILTRKGFRPLFDAGHRLGQPVERILYTPDDTGFCRILLYEDDREMGEILISGAPASMGQPLTVRAMVDDDYKGRLEVFYEKKTLGSTELRITSQQVRSLEEIDRERASMDLEYEDGFPTARPAVKSRAKPAVEKIRKEFDRARRSISPQPGQLERLLARYRTVLREIAMVQVLHPDIETLRSQMKIEPPEPPGDFEGQLMDDLLHKASEAFEAGDASEYALCVQRCYLTKDNWREGVPASSEDEVRASIQQILKTIRQLLLVKENLVCVREMLVQEVASLEAQGKADQLSKLVSVQNQLVDLLRKIQRWPWPSGAGAGPQPVDPGQA